MKAMLRQTIVLDVRAYQEAPYSGIGRYVEGLLQGLLALSARGQVARLVLVGHSRPNGPLLSQVNSNSAAHFFRFPCPRLLKKPRVFWSTFVLAWMRLFRRRFNIADEFLWISPDNIDRPFVLRRSVARRVFQVLHDVTPLKDGKKTRKSWLAFQMKLFSASYLHQGRTLLTVSQLSADEIRNFFQLPQASIAVVFPRLSQRFTTALLNPRSESAFRLLDDGEGQQAIPVLGVGRDEPYKNWGFVRSCVQSLRSQNGNFWFVFVGSCPGGRPSFCSTSGFPLGKGVVFKEEGVFWLESLDDAELAQLYREATCLVHPSDFEGYGFPIAEAFVAGLPAVYRGDAGVSPVLTSLQESQNTVPCLEVKRKVCGGDATNCLSEVTAFMESAAGAKGYRRQVNKHQLTNERDKKMLCDWESAARELIAICCERPLEPPAVSDLLE